MPALPAAQADSVRAVLLGYVAAVRNRDGAAATRALSRATRAYNARMAELARTAPEAQVRGLSLMDRLSVLMIRHRIAPGVLRTLPSDSAFAYTVNEGWVAKAMTSDPLPATMEVYGDGDSAIVPDRGLERANSGADDLEAGAVADSAIRRRNGPVARGERRGRSICRRDGGSALTSERIEPPTARAYPSGDPSSTTVRRMR